MRPATASQAAPLAALITVAPKAPAPISNHKSRRCSSRGLKPARCIQRTASQGPQVLPTAIAVASQGEAPADRFTSQAPSAIAGTCAGPHRQRVASARPAAGQNGLISGEGPGSASPSRPAAR